MIINKTGMKWKKIKNLRIKYFINGKIKSYQQSRLKKKIRLHEKNKKDKEKKNAGRKKNCTCK